MKSTAEQVMVYRFLMYKKTSFTPKIRTLRTHRPWSLTACPLHLCEFAIGTRKRKKCILDIGDAGQPSLLAFEDRDPGYSSSSQW